MTTTAFRFIVQTPHATVLDTQANSVRVVAESGQVGIRSRMEPMVLPIEAGLALVQTSSGITFVGSAGGLLFADRRGVTLYTPLAIGGGEAASVQRQLNERLADPDSEIAVRAKFGRLENRILSELRHDRPDGVSSRGVGR